MFVLGGEYRTGELELELENRILLVTGEGEEGMLSSNKDDLFPHTTADMLVLLPPSHFFFLPPPLPYFLSKEDDLLFSSSPPLLFIQQFDFQSQFKSLI